ncbi:MAG: DUF5606 domain-containing protein [Bacteroidales bacterium]|nr:DUF5606 domain-containing protein [Bacteroidales bacterium]
MLKDILSISGEPGLFKFLAQGKNSIIVEHLETGKRTTAFSSAKISSLEDISIFTDSEDLPLGKVFDRIYEKENGGPTVDTKTSPENLKKYFEEIVPDYSREKVYLSDIRKVFNWYNILHRKNMLIREEPEQKGADETAKPESPAETESVKNNASKKKTAEPAAKKKASTKKSK